MFIHTYVDCMCVLINRFDHISREQRYDITRFCLCVCTGRFDDGIIKWPIDRNDSVDLIKYCKLGNQLNY